MTNENAPVGQSGTVRKPRLVLMGEFSSGKSTLSNILLGGPTLPTQVTATRLPPVHITYGEPGAIAVTRGGDPVEIDLDDLAAVTPETYRSLHVTMRADTLELCDLIDMPGISDPNMPSDTWDDLVGPSDHVIWCTHAPQAWRQSESAAWAQMRGATSGLNLLLVTQFDKLRSPRDRTRVMDRVLSETAGKFAAVFPISLLDAMAAGDDFDAWQQSGAHAFMERLIEILVTPQAQSNPAIIQGDTPAMKPAPSVQHDHASILTANFDRSEKYQTERPATARYPQVPSETRVVPRRVQAKPGGSDRQRPPKTANRDVHSWLVETGPVT